MASVIKQAVILAGGRGVRLGPLTLKTPKPMILVNNRPFLEYLIELLKENGIEEIILLVGYLGEKIMDHFKDGSKFGVNIKYSVMPLFDKDGGENESGTRIKKAENLLDDSFLLMYCDNYWPLNLKKLSDFYYNKDKLVSVVVYNNKDNFTKNNVLVDDKNFIIKYDKNRTEQGLNGVEIGFFLINKKVLKIFPKEKFQFEKEILPQLIKKKELVGYVTGHRYYSISKLERLEATAKFLSPKKVIFLDRDGVINKKPPKADYVKKWEEFEFLPGVIQGLKKLCDNDYRIYLITNQPGVGRGMMKKEDLDLIHQNMQEELHRAGAKIDKIYCCLHSWEENCDCRKPRPGLFFRAASENFLDLSKITFIGDDERDIEAGQAAGTRNILLGKGENFLDIINKEVINK